MDATSRGVSSGQDPFARLLWASALLLGGVFFLVGLGLAVGEARFGQSAVTADGRVAGLRQTQNSEGVNYTPVVEFTTPDGQPHRFDGVSTSPPPEVGQSVRVVYSPAAPQTARIDSFVQRWLFPTLFTPVGLLLLIAGWRMRGGKRLPVPEQTQAGLGSPASPPLESE